VRQPDGAFVGSLFVFGASGFRDLMTLPVDGVYTVEVNPIDHETGTLTFTLAEVPENTGQTSIGVPTAVTIGTPGENAIRSFDATAGQKMTLSVAGNTIPGALVVVSDPDDSLLDTLFVFEPTAVSDVIDLPVTGTYTITVDPFGASTGMLTFTLEEVTGASDGAPPSKGAVRALATASAPSARTTSAAALSAAASAAPDAEPVLTLTTAEVLANDRPGPPNESDQTLTVTAVTNDSASHGSATLSGDTITYTPDAGYVGPATITYTACDDGTTDDEPDPLCSNGLILIKVTANHPPTVDGQEVATTEDKPVAVVLTGADADGDTLAFTILEEPAHGALGGTAPNLTYTPAPDYHGADSFVFRADDRDDASAPATVAIAISEVNDVPVPQPDSITGAAGQPTTVAAAALLDNDVAGPFDEHAQTLSVTAVEATENTHGTVAFADGNVTYTPEAGFTDTARASYTVCDNGTTDGRPDPRCADGVLSIVANLAPSATGQSTATARNTPVTITLAGSDPEDDPLTFAIATRPEHGTVDAAGAKAVYTPASGFTGSDAFTFTVGDGRSTSAPATVTVEVTDTPPPNIRPDAVATAVDTPVLIDVLANDTATAGGLDSSTLAVVVAPTNGTATLEGASIRYAPAPGVTPDDRFTYQVCDTFGVCGRAVVTVSVVVPNRPPTAAADDYKVDVGSTLNVAAPGLLANDADPDHGDAIQARLDTGVSAGNLLLRFDGSFTYTPAAGFAGLDSFTYVAVDRAGLRSAPVKVTIDVIPPGPLAVDDAYTTTKDNVLVVQPAGVLANDRDTHSTDVLTASLSRAAFRGTVDLNPDGSFVYTPDPGFVGTDTFRYVVTDLPGLVSTPAQVTIDVAAPTGPAPTVNRATPADGTTVCAPAPVSANVTAPEGETIERWKVTTRNLDRGTPVVLASGNSEPPAPMTTFDPTTLVNGAYQILIAVESSAGGTTTVVSNVVVCGEMKLGDYTTTYLDLEASIDGFPVQVLRTYDTTDKRLGDFGTGWRVELSSYRATPNNRLGLGGWSTEPFGFPFTRFRFKTTIPHFVTVTSPDGRVEVFDFVPAPTGPMLSLTAPEFVPKPGTRTTSKLEDADPPVLALAGNSIASFFGGTIYDPRLFRLTTADGFVLIIDRYDGLRSLTDRNGNQLLVTDGGLRSESTDRELRFTRDGAGRITAIRAPGGKQTTYTYSAAGDLRTFTGVDGGVETFSYDGGHRLLSVDGAGGTRLRTLTYGPDGRVTSLKDATGNTITLTSDVDARSEIVTSASGRLTTVSAYGAEGNLASTEQVFEGHSRVTRYEYDGEGRPTRTISPLGRTETVTYDDAGNVTSYTTAKGEKWSFTYNSLNLLTTTTAPDGKVVETLAYDATGNVTSTTLADGTTLRSTYDGEGRLLTETDSFGTTTYTYDTDHQVTTETDPAGGITSYGYDAAGRLSTIENPAGEHTQYTWNVLDDLVEVVGPDGSKQTLGYDAFGRLTSRTDTANRATRYDYDAAGRLVASIDRTGARTTYAYDKDGNLATVAFPDGDVTTITTDAVGRRISIRDADAIVERTYNDADDLLTERTRGNDGVALPDATLSYTTDPNGNPTTLSGPGGEQRYQYDSRGRLSSVRDAAGRTFALSYDGTDQLTGLARPNGVDDTLTYKEGSLTSRNASRGSEVISRAEYVLDALRRRVAMTDSDGKHEFTYDRADRLTAATHPGTSGLPAESFAYDSLGNRTSWTGSPPASVRYDTAKQLLSDGSHDYTYDAEGRLVQRRDRATGGITRYRWNGAGQLAAVTAPDGSTSSYRYDALGRRVEVNDDGAVRRFVYSGPNLLLELDGSNALRARYVTGVYPDSVYEVVRDGTSYYPLYDAVGSITALTDDSGASVGRVRYSSFGVPQSSGVADTGFTFTGHQYDSATGLIYARSRYYDPSIGRFVSQDPEPAANPYTYAVNSPLQFTDPTGRSATTERITVECKSTWNAAQMADALVKLKAYKGAARRGQLIVTHGPRPASAGAAQAAFRKAKNLGSGMDADHIIELVLGGAVDALQGIDSSVNRSFGAQIGNALRKLKNGTKIIVGSVRC
jgi:RHS repeat-associated protein